MRMLQFFYVFKATGPMMVMIYEMMIKVGSWLAITMVFICSYAIASESVLHPNSEINWKLLYHFPRKAYWQLHGELLLDEIEGGQDCTNQPALYNNYTQPRCPSPLGQYFVPVLLGIYMLATNVLLVNLLIAIFSNTVNRIDSNNMKHIMHRRFKLLLEFKQSPYFPPPLNVISALYFIVCWSKRRLIQQVPSEKRPGSTI
ncbi:unnamed protein product [Lymnaea stagnalis]|uniref:Ion transport domain-containing protein n=1 Tax=Lymnaea stagnalis TaxID=6523 RepID=A0AAV2IKQ8_LYMST